MPTTTCSRKWPSTARPAPCGPTGCGTTTGPRNENSWKLRFHAQTAGCSLQDKQPEVNLIRVAYQALAAVLGGCQSLHTNSMDETLALPSEHAVTLALRTQQVLAHETGVTNTVDPLGGSYFVETLTRQMQHEARDVFRSHRGAGRHAAGHRSRILPPRDRRGGVRLSARVRRQAQDRGRRQRLSGGRTKNRSRSCRSTTPSKPSRSRRWPASSAIAAATTCAARSTRCAVPPKPATTCCRRCSTRPARGPRWAKSMCALADIYGRCDAAVV